MATSCESKKLIKIESDFCSTYIYPQDYMDKSLEEYAFILEEEILRKEKNNQEFTNEEKLILYFSKLIDRNKQRYIEKCNKLSRRH